MKYSKVKEGIQEIEEGRSIRALGKVFMLGVAAGVGYYIGTLLVQSGVFRGLLE